MGARIREIRGKLTLDEFSGIIGISRSMVSKYENGDAWPKPGILGKILEYGKRSSDWLFCGDESSPQFIPISTPLKEKDQKAIQTADDLLAHYGLDKRFRVTEIHHPPPPTASLAPDIQELIEIMTALDPEYRADVLKYSREKRIVYEATLKKEVVRQIEAAKFQELKEVEAIKADLSTGGN